MCQISGTGPATRVKWPCLGQGFRTRASYWIKAKKLSSQIVIPSSPFSFQAKTGLPLPGGAHAQEVKDDLLDQRQILRCIVHTDRAGILSHRDIKHPVQLVFDGQCERTDWANSTGVRLRELM